jgi:hypothetical protein
MMIDLRRQYLCQKCRHYEYWYLDEDNCLSGGCCTDVAFPQQARVKKCKKFRHLSKEENLKVQKQRLGVLDSLRFNHEHAYHLKTPTTKDTVDRYKWRLEDYLFHKHLAQTLAKG